ncbi:acid phosphatase [Mycolicibacterium acapulense]|uniref:Acid phosphatase n=1 Tax=Mycobacterium lehmannii TaxID=2048550 RepID=A0A101AAV3_9MYCO|nr:acid phosphatase [Mycobacterium lehmannii]KUH93158.1 acid phosphatase [Mycolicibacterium acapulense]KUH96784.1 acid phosphatase [Mycolicibacterium acapulense]KUI17592.1 acid phosphatase [Mycolicibacterium acapulense]KUI19502.1 acid phosphatase [Mycobacterium lehmannii]
MALLEHRLILLRHGETEWSRSGRHTSHTDLELTAVGVERAKLAAEALAELELDHPLVLSSPLRRAVQTAELAGLNIDEVSPLLREWDYGRYEGLTTPEIRETVPDWLIWTHGADGGESVETVTQRADRALESALSHMTSRDVVFVGHAHFSRSMIARWVELPVSDGIRFAMAPASLAVLGFEHAMRQIIAQGLTGHQDPCKPR